MAFRKPGRTTQGTAVPRLPKPPRPTVGQRISTWRRHVRYGAHASFARLAARPLSTALTALVIGLALALPALFQVGLDNARGWAAGLGEARDVTVFLKADIDAAGAAAIAAAVGKRADVDGVRIRTPADGLAELRKLSGFGAALDALGANPLPSILVVTPKAVPARGDPPLVAELRSDRRVDFVQYDAELRQRVSAILGLGERTALVLAALLAIATLLIVGNTVRADIQGCEQEISVMRLVGAGGAFVRRPFLFAGAWYGLAGGVLAVGFVLAIEFALREPLGRLAGGWSGLPLRGLGVIEALVVIAAGVVLGWCGAFLAASSYGRRAGRA